MNLILNLTWPPHQTALPNLRLQPTKVRPMVQGKPHQEISSQERFVVTTTSPYLTNRCWHSTATVRSPLGFFGPKGDPESASEC